MDNMKSASLHIDAMNLKFLNSQLDVISKLRRCSADRSIGTSVLLHNDCCHLVVLLYVTQIFAWFWWK
jgi:hypothetical protein